MQDEGAGPLPRRVAREVLILLAFCLFSVVMTWPWARDVLFAIPDEGDPYLNAWIGWWDFHQTFRDPLNLFHPPIFFPERYALAFSENNWGLTLPFFPLYALGMTPLAVHNVTQLFAYAFCGYGAFRLARTMTGSAAAGWVAGIGFAFIPYRFQHISHINYTSAGWVPILLEALVLFVSVRSRRRAAWLGVAFAMNGLSCIHWLVLSVLPLGLTGLWLAWRAGVLRDRELWRRGGAALAVACLVLLPFLLPYRAAAKLYGFERNAGETRGFSALPIDWVSASPWNKLWAGLGPFPTRIGLFPGALLPLLAAAGLLLARREPAEEAVTSPEAPETPPPGRRRLLRFLDAGALASLLVAIPASLPGGVKVLVGETVVLKASDPLRSSTLLLAFLIPRVALSRSRWKGLLARIGRLPDGALVGLVWVVLGFFGSLGMNFPFHTVLFHAVPIFRSIRAPDRWGMMAFVGLALLAGLGLACLLERLTRRASRTAAWALSAAVCLLLLFELRVAPLDLVRGEPLPDEVTRFVRDLPGKGAVVELPSNVFPVNYRAMLRAADHGKPLVDAVSGFAPKNVWRLEELQAKRPIPDAMLDFLESLPVSWVVLRSADVPLPDRPAFEELFRRAVATRRLAYCGTFDGSKRNRIYAVVRNEPRAPSRPEGLSGRATRADDQRWVRDEELPGNLDVPAEGAEVAGTFRAIGWARRAGEDLDVALLIDHDEVPDLVVRRFNRPDVSAAYPWIGDASAAGFEAEVRLPDGAPGQEHTIQAVLLSRDGRYRPLEAKRIVRRRGEAGSEAK